MSVEWTIKAADVAIVIATVAGPILAVWASEWRYARKREHESQDLVFRTLMATRSQHLNFDHVSALNQIDVVFPQNRYPKIADAWDRYLTQLGADKGAVLESQRQWDANCKTRLADLIEAIANGLNIPLLRGQIERRSYYPESFANREDDQYALRTLMRAVLEKGRPLNVRVIGPEEAPKTTN